MAPHLTGVELDLMRQWFGQGQRLKHIHGEISAKREAKGIEVPKRCAIRRACRGFTHLFGRGETRGRKQSLSKAEVARLNDARKRLVAKADAEYEVPYKLVLKSARVKVHRTTAARHLKAKYGVKWRRFREKPPRSKEHVDERKKVCRIWKKKPKTFLDRGCGPCYRLQEVPNTDIESSSISSTLSEGSWCVARRMRRPQAGTYQAQH